LRRSRVDQILVYAKEGRPSNLASTIIPFGKYFSLRILAAKILVLCSSLQYCFANNTLLKHIY